MFDLSKMNFVPNAKNISVGSIINAKTDYDDSELMLVVQISSDECMLICIDGNRWCDTQYTLELVKGVAGLWLNIDTLRIPNVKNINGVYIPVGKTSKH